MELKKNISECFLGEIISPSEYYMVSKLENHVNEVKNLEKLLSNEMNKTSAVPDADSLFIHSCVAVKSNTTTRDIWQRGEIRNRIKGDIYNVFLIDHGFSSEVTRQNLRIIIDSKFTDVEPLSFKLCLYGIVPTVTDTDNSGGIKEKVSETWHSRAMEFVQWILSQFLSIHVKKIYILKRIVFGDLILFDKTNNEGKSLRRLLLQTQYAVYSERYFQIKVMDIVPILKISQDVEFSSTKNSDSSSANGMTQKSKELDMLHLQPKESKSCDTESQSSKNAKNSEEGNNLQSTYCKSNSELKDTMGNDSGNMSHSDSKMGSKKQLCTNKTETETKKSDNIDMLENISDTSDLNIKMISDKNTKLNINKSSTWIQKNDNLSGLNCISKIGSAACNSKVSLQKYKRENKIEGCVERDKSISPFSSSKKSGDFQSTHSANSLQGKDRLVSSNGERNERCNSVNSDHNSKQFKLFIEGDIKMTTEFKDDYSFQIFTLFSDSVVEPVDVFKNLSISRNIILNLEEAGNFKDLTYIQRWAIPSILRGHNVVMIGAGKSGKTLSYIISISELMQDELNFDEVPSGNGPLVIILCSGSQSCEYIYNIFRFLLSKRIENRRQKSDIKVYYAHGNGSEKDIWVQLTNGSDILITTPHCLVRLLKYKTITNLERLRILVLDDTDIITEEPFLSKVMNILHNARLSKNCQKVICGEKWTPQIYKLCHFYAKNHVLLIGSHLEAAIYAKLKPHVYLLESRTKNQILYDVIKDKIGKRKILIACENKSEVIYLDEILRAKGHIPLIAHSNTLAQDMKGTQKSWKYSKKPNIFIMSDDVLHELSIQDAEVLIHYSLPYKSKTNFAYRFSTLMKNYKNYLNEENIEEKLTVVIFVDDQNHLQLPHVVDFIIRLGGKVPKNALEICEKITTKIELNKTLVPICLSLLQFGVCKNTVNCNKRHALIKEIDCIETPISGLIKFEVLHVHDANHLSVRIIENFSKGNIKKTIHNFGVQIDDELKKYYEHEENRRCQNVIKINDLCALELMESGTKKFYRTKVLECIKFNARNEVTEVTIKLIDFGWILNATVSQLYELPEELMKYPPQAIDVFLCNLLPNDFDRRWSKGAINFSKAIFLQKLKPNQNWVGKVVLSLKESLHLHSVKLCQFLEKLNVYAIDLCAQSKFLSHNIAIENKQYFENLSLLCKKSNIELTEDKSEISESELKVQVLEPQWAFFDKDLIRVHFTSAENTSMLFVRLIKFEDLLEKLEKECQAEAEKARMKKQSKLNNSVVNSSLRVGVYCLALYMDKWHRGRIISIADNKHLVYFIDYGDFHFTDEILPISKKLLLQLPAQAIECSLSGITHEDDCSEKILDEIYAFSEDGEADLYAHVIEKNVKPQITNGRKYEINLLNLKGRSLNKILIDSGLIKSREDCKVQFENIEFIPSDDEKSEELELLPDSNCSLQESIINEACLTTHENEIENVEHSLSLLDLKPDLFDDENAQNFLQDFMIQVFPQLANTNDNKKKYDKETGPEVSVKKLPDETENNKLIESPREYLHDFFLKTRKRQRNRSLYQEILCFTPRVLWNQNHSEIKIKVILTNVLSYELNCSTRNILFRCLNDNKLYVVSLKLFGAINADLTKVQLKTFFVQISLKKLCPLQWPRLHNDKKKFRWINLDLESSMKSENSYVQDLCKKEITRIKSGKIKTPNVNEDIDFVSSCTEESDEYSESSCDSDNSCFGSTWNSKQKFKAT